MRKQLIRYAFLALFVSTGRAEAVLYSFECITDNTAGDCAIGETQLFFDVSDSSSDVMFYFGNTGPEASSITDVYFDDNASLFSFISLIDDSDGGVQFSEFASPPNLPGGNDPMWSFNADWSADSDPATQPNGVNPGEWLAIYLEYNSGIVFNDVLIALNNGELRIGIHVQGFDGGGSESFINNPIPEPTTMLLFGTGLAGLAGISRRRKK